MYCDEVNCRVGVGCGNRQVELACLRLVRSRFGFGVVSIVTLPAVVAVGEYCGVLCTGEAFTNEMRTSGFGFEFNERSVCRQPVYVDSNTCGSVCRFINHSCTPNCRFQVLLNREMRKVTVVTDEIIPAGSELTLKYRSYV